MPWQSKWWNSNYLFPWDYDICSSVCVGWKNIKMMPLFESPIEFWPSDGVHLKEAHFLFPRQQKFGKIISWPSYKKTEQKITKKFEFSISKSGNIIKLAFIWKFFCVHFGQYLDKSFRWALISVKICTVIKSFSKVAWFFMSKVPLWRLVLVFPLVDDKILELQNFDVLNLPKQNIIFTQISSFSHAFFQVSVTEEDVDNLHWKGSK